LEDIIEEIMGEEILDESDKTRDMRELAKLRSLLTGYRIYFVIALLTYR